MTVPARDPIDHFTIQLDVSIRLCSRDDLRDLEWFGEFTPHRALIEEAYARQEKGEVLMLVAMADEFPIGQLWIDLTRAAAESVGELWALRVLPTFQGRGIGSRLIARAEAMLRERGFAWSEMRVERENGEARRLYERRGYRVIRAERETVPYDTPDGRHEAMHLDEWVMRKTLQARPATAGRRGRRVPPLVVRWTIGDVSDEGYEALRLSVWSAMRLIGTRARYVVCVNSIALGDARARAGRLPEDVEWRDVTGALWPDIRPYLAPGMAEGVAWKFAPLRIDGEAHELALDNDCIMWELPEPMQMWLRAPDRCLIAEDVRACFGQFADRCGAEPRNSGIRGVPAHFDLGGALLDLLHQHGAVLTSELDEQGLQIAALSRPRPASVVSVSDVAISSPFPPHLPDLGRCGAHFVGLNAKTLPWEHDGRPAVDHIRAYWRQHRTEVYARVGLRPGADAAPGR